MGIHKYFLFTTTEKEFFINSKHLKLQQGTNSNTMDIFCKQPFASQKSVIMLKIMLKDNLVWTYEIF